MKSNFDSVAPENAQAPESLIQVAVVSPLRCFGEGLAALIEKDTRLTCSGVAGCLNSAHSILFGKSVDVLLIEAKLDNLYLPAAMVDRHMRQRLPGRVLFSDPADAHMAPCSLKDGVAGFVLMSDGWTLFREALLSAARNGKPVVSPQLAAMQKDCGQRAPQFAGIDLLSARQRQVLFLIGSGLKNQAVAQRIGVSSKTVEAHKEHLKSKLGVHSAAELFLYAKSWCEALTAADSPTAA